MTPYRFIIQQTFYDGETYTKGSVIDTYDDFGVVCKEFAEDIMPEPKPAVTKDWPGEDGLEIYIPKNLPAKEFDVEAEFLIVGNQSLADDAATADAQSRRKNFIKFLYGRNAGAVGSRLAIYDEHSGNGYKDVVVKKVLSDTSFRQSGGNEAVYLLKVTFTVYDPATDVTPSYTNNNLTGLIWN